MTLRSLLERITNHIPHHVMFIDVVETFEVGDTFEVTLQFENAGDIAVEIEVFEEQP